MSLLGPDLPVTIHIIEAMNVFNVDSGEYRIHINDAKAMLKDYFSKGVIGMVDAGKDAAKSAKKRILLGLESKNSIRAILSIVPIVTHNAESKDISDQKGDGLLVGPQQSSA